ncbi:MAG: OmpH family outer membrane protein [Cyanobacteria bacterium SIG29]|nr:OmpH family outer membrane protein [Cyanobacteria bacterium SIG29]
MKKQIKLVTLSVLVFALGMTAGNFAVSDVPANYKVAIVDVQKVVSSSAQVKALKADQKKKGQELAKFIETAKTAIEKEKDTKKREALEQKYNKEFNAKRLEMAKTNEKKLLEIDKNITDLINTKAKEDGYNLVLVKGAVLSGGTDITDEITKAVK